MSLINLLPARIHGLGDYASAFALILVGLLVGGSGEARGAGIVLGLVLLVVSLLTDYRSVSGGSFRSSSTAPGTT